MKYTTELFRLIPSILKEGNIPKSLVKNFSMFAVSGNEAAIKRLKKDYVSNVDFSEGYSHSILCKDGVIYYITPDFIPQEFEIELQYLVSFSCEYPTIENVSHVIPEEIRKWDKRSELSILRGNEKKTVKVYRTVINAQRLNDILKDYSFNDGALNDSGVELEQKLSYYNYCKFTIELVMDNTITNYLMRILTALRKVGEGITHPIYTENAMKYKEYSSFMYEKIAHECKAPSTMYINLNGFGE